ncbi:hypothetical protein K438DRAFT_1782628 [Mycena galopus ATCC 62051]|nr:hypothetical protein K438DRAFT_1782628 [Mycena galopus ATCC 62051]
MYLARATGIDTKLWFLNQFSQFSFMPEASLTMAVASMILFRENDFPTWTNHQIGAKQSLVEAMENARSLDERVAREIEIPIRSDERAQIDLEMEAIRSEKQDSAVRLKALQARKSELCKQPKAAKAGGARTVFVSASSSGRVKTRTTGFTAVPTSSLLRSPPPTCDYTTPWDPDLFQDAFGDASSHAAPQYPLSSAAMNFGADFWSDVTNFTGFESTSDLDNFDWSFLDQSGVSLPTSDASMVASTSSMLEYDTSLIGISAPFLHQPQSSPAPSFLQLPPIPAFSPPPSSPMPAPVLKPVSRKRKGNIDGLDPSNVVETKRSRTVPQRTH